MSALLWASGLSAGVAIMGTVNDPLQAWPLLFVVSAASLIGGISILEKHNNQ